MQCFLACTICIVRCVVSIIGAEFAAAAVLISFGAVLGKVSAMQLLVMAIFEVVVYEVNQLIVFDRLEVQIYLSIYLSVCLSIDRLIDRSIDRSNYRSIRPSVHPSIHPSV